MAWDKTDANKFVSFHLDFGSMLTIDGEDTFKSIANTQPSGAYGGAIRGNIIVEVNGNWTKPDMGYQVAISRNDGVNWTKIDGTKLTEKEWVNSLLSFHPQNDNIVYAGKYRFDNIENSNTFETLSKLVYGVFGGNGDIVYSFSGSTIYKSTNKGATWTTPYPSLNIPSGASLRQIAIDPTDQNRIYAAVKNKGVYIITNTADNGGEVITRGPDNGISESRYGTVDIYTVTIDPNNPNKIYAAAYDTWNGQSNGIFYSNDYGMTWVNINGNLGSEINIKNISVNPHNSYVYIASYAGTWKLPPPSSTSTAER